MGAAAPFIGPAIGLGGSIVGGISGKKAAKQQQKLAEEQMAMMRPLLQAQIAGAQYGIEGSKPLIGDARASLLGAGQAARDMQNFWRPLAFGGRSAIDKWLSPERNAINQGYRASLENMKWLRGPSKVSAVTRADEDRQTNLSNTIFGARKEGANQLTQLANILASIGGTQAGAGTSLLSAGLSGGREGFGLLGQQQDRAYGAGQAASQNWGQIGEQLGGFLGQIFKPKPQATAAQKSTIGQWLGRGGGTFIP